MKNLTTGHELVTERQHREDAELALHKSEEIFRLLVDSVTDYAIFMLDPTGHVTTWNRGAQRIKGYSTEEILGQHFSIFYPLEAIARGWPSHELAVATAEGRFEDEGWRLRKDGSAFWANVIITVVYDKGRHRGFSKVTRDLTEKKRWEGELQQARHLLEQRVEQRTEELTRANEALQVEVKERESVEQELRQLERRLRQKVDELAAADRRWLPSATGFSSCTWRTATPMSGGRPTASWIASSNRWFGSSTTCSTLPDSPARSSGSERS
jgi:PAS domain S-box-containing protein